MGATSFNVVEALALVVFTIAAFNGAFFNAGGFISADADFLTSSRSELISRTAMTGGGIWADCDRAPFGKARMMSEGKAGAD